MKTKYWLIIGMVVLLVGGIGLIFYNPSEKIDCDSYGAIYLKASELDKASEIADNKNVIVVIPELNQVIGRTEILNCPSFDYDRYIEGI